MELREALGEAIREFRKAKGLSQEDFSEVSSRTYLSILERGLKSPTLDKIEELASVLGVHPLSLLTLAYVKKDKGMTLDKVLGVVRSEQLP